MANMRREVAGRLADELGEPSTKTRTLGLGVVIALLVAGTGWVIAAPASAAAGQYSVTDLGTLPGGRTSIAYDINGAGEVVGASDFGSGSVSHGVLWHDGTITDLGQRGGPSNSSVASGINDDGQIVGYGRVPWTPYEKAILWENGTMVDLSMARAYSLNEQVQVAGGTNPSPSSDAVLWEAGTTTYLGTYGGQAYDINNRRQLVGRYTPCCPYTSYGFLWENGTVTKLSQMSVASGINDAGQVVGGNVLWDNGTVTYLGTLGGASTSAYAINNGGQVVGTSTNASGSWHAFLWEDGAMQDLDTLPGGSRSEAWGINEFGQVVGSSTDSTGNSHAVLWSRVDGTHDVAVVSASADPRVVLAGDPVTITATVRNQGDWPETFDVTAFANSILIGTQTVTNLTPGDSVNISFPWDTSTFDPGTYSINVAAVPVPGETDLADNELSAGVVLILPNLLVLLRTIQVRRF